MNTNRHVISVLINRGQLADKVCRDICEPSAADQVNHRSPRMSICVGGCHVSISCPSAPGAEGNATIQLDLSHHGERMYIILVGKVELVIQYFFLNSTLGFRED